MVADGSVVTTTGISASIPMMLTLIEAIGGQARAEAVARDLGIAAWDARHSSAAFALTRRFAMTVLLNRLAFWRHERLGIHLRPGMDGAALALLADGWSRTYRSTVVTYAAAPAPVETANGLGIIPDRVASDWPAPHRLEAGTTPAAARDLDRMLVRIGARYGDATRDVVAMQLEYPRPERGR